MNPIKTPHGNSYNRGKRGEAIGLLLWAECFTSTYTGENCNLSKGGSEAYKERTGKKKRGIRITIHPSTEQFPTSCTVEFHPAKYA